MFLNFVKEQKQTGLTTVFVEALTVMFGEEPIFQSPKKMAQL